MQSSVARREEIQKRLQLLKDANERELKAFDELAAAHPQMAVEELKKLAHERAKADEPTSLQVAGTTVNVGDYVGTIDDPVLLIAAERGFLARDPVKRVYLGERGKVIRVMPSFQGKPAVELHFADGAEKVFLAECLDVGEQSQKHKAPAASKAKKGVLPSHDAAKPEEQKPQAQPHDQESVIPVPAPAWDQLAMPRRGSRPVAPSAASTASPVPLPSPTPPTTASSTMDGLSAGSKEAGFSGLATSSSSPEKGSATKDSLATAPVALKQPPPKQRVIPSPESSSEASTKRVAVAPAAQTAKNIASVSSTSASGRPSPSVRQHQAIGLVMEALSSSPSQALSLGVEELGNPSDELFVDTEDLRKDSLDMDDLAKTPRPDFLEVLPYPKEILPCPEEESRIPRRCPPNYEAKFSFDDEGTHLPRCTRTKLPDVRYCWVAGYIAGKTSPPLQFKAVSLGRDATSLEAVLAIVSRELSWNTAAGSPARRLFTEEGHEIMWSDAVVDGSRVVATPGDLYRKAALVARVAAGKRSAPSPSPSPANAPAPTCATTGTATALTRPAEGGAPEKSPAPRRPTCVAGRPAAAAGVGQPHLVSKDPPRALVAKKATPRQPKTAKSPRTGAKTPRSTRIGGVSPPPVSAAGDRKATTLADSARSGVIHIRVYENGNYDADTYDRIYRTITVRPTYKTLNSVKVLVTRELEWRSGRRVDMLFDATGMEITSLEQLTDGASIVASAGDRFVVPYPNSNLHREAMKLSRVQ